MARTPDEFQLLVSASLDRAPRPDWCGSEEALDWNRVRALVGRHRVGGVLSDWLGRHPVPAPDWFRSDLLLSCHSQSVTYLLQVAETAHLTAGLARIGVSSIVMKGVAAAERLYKPHPHLRYSIDIDLLVSPDEFRRAGNYLSSEGYIRQSPEDPMPDDAFSMVMRRLNCFEFYKPSTELQVELHHRPLLDPYKMPIGFDSLLRRSVQLPIGGVSASAFSPEDEVVYLCSHGAGHDFFRLKWIADVSRAIRLAQASFDDLRAHAKSLNCERDFLASLALLRDLDDGPAITTRERRKVGRLVALCKREMHGDREDDPANFTLSDVPAHVAKTPALLQSADNWRSFGFLLLVRLTSIQDVTFLRLGAKWSWLYFMLGPWLALARILRRLSARSARTR